MIRPLMVLLAMAAALYGTPVSACRYGGVETLFEERPAGYPAGFQVVHGRLITVGRRVETARAQAPYSPEGALVGLLHQTGRSWRDALPVYAGNSSCHHDTFGGVDESGREIYLVGQRLEATGQLPRRFVATGRRYPQMTWGQPVR